jgi:uncharacterized protein (TIGR00299 family) protein
MKILYFDCFAGISGDMTLSAFLALGIEPGALIRELKKLPIGHWEMKISEVSRHGITATHTDVLTADEAHHHHHHHHAHRTMADIAGIIEESGLPPGARDLARRIFMRLALAEAKVHNTTPEKVHFHEVGAVDSIIDIVGTAICVDMLSPDKIFASVLHDGHGFTECQHGIIPVPVPAVTEILSARETSFKQLDIEGELMTPTGAAIVAELAESFGTMPGMTVKKVGYGAGTKEYALPNLLRLVWGEMLDSPALQTDTVTVIETNVDNTTPEILGYVMNRLFDAGARDVFFTPIYMKKNRPATMISVLCDDADAAVMEDILFHETSTIGVRKHHARRTCLPRKAVVVSTPYGDVKAKEITCGASSRIAVEYEDACRLANEKNVPVKDILRYSAE